jgi:hypothetical protein
LLAIEMQVIAEEFSVMFSCTNHFSKRRVTHWDSRSGTPRSVTVFITRRISEIGIITSADFFSEQRKVRNVVARKKKDTRRLDCTICNGISVFMSKERSKQLDITNKGTSKRSSGNSKPTQKRFGDTT